MTDAGKELKEELERLRGLTSSDFIALAPFHEQDQRFRWTYVTGNRNDRNQHMTIKVGQGLSGSVLRFGRWVKVDDTNPDAERARLECPLMLAEHLRAAAAFPIYVETVVKGILYIGKRSHTTFQQEEVEEITAAISKLAVGLAKRIHEHVK
ncbi:GAF domain-containing protein [Paenibacillus sp. SYP-B3998]|uniref:GAF domain-containing protein n=1 Tax=Paenibacillus sp. SYP-B3998 TaxID=2678564 RepID=A0A6G3ZRV9_9BACL|nr:GAF domain-containing protein [Paenibacillus sp. SYP-B3998]NEW04855.1 GAF domain-containing protein [Paenibacillus sp. SYP-B3998]